jgi:hypothetical protein
MPESMGQGGKVMKYEGTIVYMIGPGHPDRKHVRDTSKAFTYSDTFTFDREFPREVIEDYIKRELALVAGGGYDTEHIYNVCITIKRID